MRRTTISLPERVAEALDREARRRRVPVSRLACEAIEESLGLTGRRRIPFAALGRSGHRTTARNIEGILEADWDVDRGR